ncbi:MAG: hypothetical protein BA861_00850 [Desulfobacterales bacterium S3730MH5]|nr:MAG: hypothetical protein BA861_00850 [Desulfobacterales bacterium S3730MH5]OEU77804.1 MAG: hypothetical protein BA865_12370 [Desulfobacterales bacterium S5133MH4]
MNVQVVSTIQPLKKSFVIVALIFLFIGFAIECGGPNLPFFQGFLPTTEEMIEKAYKGIDATVEDDAERLEARTQARKEITESKPPGYSLEADGLYLWIVFFSILISLIGMLITKTTVHRVGMIVSLINSIIIIFMSIFLIVTAILKLIIMIGLLFALPVGPVIYMVIYKPFPKDMVLLLGGLGLLCKIVAAVLLWIGGSHMVRIKSATLLLVTGFVTFFIIVFGLGLAGIFASIADAIIGIIIAVIVIIWSIYMLIGSIRGLFSKAAR